MDDQLATGIERAVFGPVPLGFIDDWLAAHVRDRLGRSVHEVFARQGRVTAVYGLRLADGERLAAKIHRQPANLQRLAAVADCERTLAAAGFPCPRPVDGPACRDSVAVMLESWHSCGDPGDARDPAVRLAIARALAWQVRILRSFPAERLAADRPAWTRYEAGPWPAPHDQVLDFSSAPSGYDWLDRLAGQAADVLTGTAAVAVTGHGDWVCQNLRFSGGAVSAAYDWDSLIGAGEPVIAGLSAGAYTEGGPAPSPADVALFLADYERHREVPFTGAERSIAAAAAAWIIAYNARCGLSLLSSGLGRDGDGTPLRVLERHRDSYLTLRWPDGAEADRR